MPWSSSSISTPSSMPKKSKCHHERRNSPSVASLQADLLLLLDDLLDLAVLDLLELGGGDLALLALGARLLQRRGAQQAADHVGAERRLGSCGHRAVLLGIFGRANHGRRASRQPQSARVATWARPMCTLAPPGSTPPCDAARPVTPRWSPARRGRRAARRCRPRDTMRRARG